MKHILLLIACLLTITDIVASTQCRIVRYDENDGLPQWHITQMTQDRQGMIWFSTWNGICRYDGYDFKGFKGHVGDGSAISNDRFRNVWLTADGNIGCRVDDDLFIFNLKTYRFEKRNGLKQNGKHAKSIKPQQPYTYTDRQGVAWSVYYNGKLTYKIPGSRETLYADAAISEAARLCMPDMQGNLWVAGTSGLYKISFLNQYGKIIRNDEGNETKTFFIDSHNRYWIATKGDNAIHIFDRNNKSVGYLSESGKISPAFYHFYCPVYCISQTHDGTIWMGSKPGGLFRLKEQSGGMSYKIDRIPGLPCNNIYDIKEDRWGRLWIATLGDGVFCIPNPDAMRPVAVFPRKGSNGYPKDIAQRARMVYITKNDMMLVATTNGLLTTKLLPGKDIQKMKFFCHTRESGRKDALSCSATMNIAEDKKGRIFVSTESGGINMITSKSLTSPSLSFKHFDKTNGLPTDIALSVTPFQDKLLIASSNSIILFNPDNNTSRSFGKRHFLSECRFSEAIPQELPDGRWIFGLQDGTYFLDLKHTNGYSFLPNIALTDISIQGTDRDIAINATDTLTLTANERSMTLSFAALDYSPDSRIRYMFSLAKGGDDRNRKWNDLGNNHSITLLDLNPGTYTLFIKSTNADGMWGDNTRKLTIIVTPKFSETTTALILLVLLVTLFAGGIVYTIVYIRRIRRQRHEALEAYLALLNSGMKENASTPPTLKQKLSEEDEKLMMRVSAFVDKHISDADIGVSDIADAAAVSRSGLQRKMKQIFGVTPLDFLKEARIKHACDLLSSTSKTIGEIAFDCGFSDPKYFSRSFKASTGKSPKEWREQEELA